MYHLDEALDEQPLRCPTSNPTNAFSSIETLRGANHGVPDVAVKASHNPSRPLPTHPRQDGSTENPSTMPQMTITERPEV